MIHAKRRTIPLSKVRTIHGIRQSQVEEISASTRVKPPILVIQSRSGKTYQILDGHHRYTAAKRAGRRFIVAFVVPREAWKQYPDDIEAWPLANGRHGIPPMSIDDLIVVRWKGQDRTYDTMRGDDSASVLASRGRILRQLGGNQ